MSTEPVTFERKKLGRRKARGVYYPELKHIEVDPRLKGEEELEVIIHEMTHHLLPYLDEEAVEMFGKQLGSALFTLGYRKIPKK
jgi:predicted SprT family Zn-dependent metalloprotease